MSNNIAPVLAEAIQRPETKGAMDGLLGRSTPELFENEIYNYYRSLGIEARLARERDFLFGANDCGET